MKGKKLLGITLLILELINRCGFHEKTKLYLNKEFIEENMNDGNMDIEDDDDNKIKKDVNIPLNDINEDNSIML